MIKLVLGGFPCTEFSIAQKVKRINKIDFTADEFIAFRNSYKDWWLHISEFEKQIGEKLKKNGDFPQDEKYEFALGLHLFLNCIVAYDRMAIEAEKTGDKIYYFFENVNSMKKEIKEVMEEILSRLYGGVMNTTNSALVSAQNRKRIYFTNFGDIEQPEDKGILLKDILDTTVMTEQIRVAELVVNNEFTPVNNPENTNNLKFLGGIKSNRKQWLDDGKQFSRNFSQGNRVYSTDGKSASLTAQGGGIVDKYGYLPEKFNPYNSVEINEKSPTLTTQVTSQSNSGTTMCVIPIETEELDAVPIENCNTSAKYLLKNLKHLDEKSCNLTASCYKGIGSDGTTTVAIPIETEELDAVPIIVSNQGKSIDKIGVDKSLCLLARDYKGFGNQQMAGVLERIEIETEELDTDYYKGNQDTNVFGKIVSKNTSNNNGQPAQCCRIYNVDNKSVCLDGDSRKYIFVEHNENYQSTNKPITIYEVKDGQITIKGEQYPIKLPDGYYIIRKLTVSECRRLQTIPDWYVMNCSKSQNYKMLGNGWTNKVVEHYLSHIPNIDSEEIEVLSLYDGMSGGMIALTELGCDVKKYVAYEIDKYAIQTTKDNFDIVEHRGDAFAVRDENWIY